MNEHLAQKELFEDPNATNPSTIESSKNIQEAIPSPSATTKQKRASKKTSQSQKMDLTRRKYSNSDKSGFKKALSEIQASEPEKNLTAKELVNEYKEDFFKIFEKGHSIDDILSKLKSAGFTGISKNSLKLLQDEFKKSL